MFILLLLFQPSFPKIEKKKKTKNKKKKKKKKYNEKKKKDFDQVLRICY